MFSDTSNRLKLFTSVTKMANLLICISFIILIQRIDQINSLPTNYPGYAVIIDAGSSGSRCWVYKLTPVGSRKLPKIEFVGNEKEKGGMAKLYPDIAKMSESLSKMIAFAKSKIPAQQHVVTPIYFMATAGMRYLTESNATEVFDTINKFLGDKTKCPFHHDTPARILPGQEEGTFAWLSANHLLGLLDADRISDYSSSTHGILEMGGASTQITFVPRSQILNGVFNFKFHHHKFHIYSHSYLNYGQDVMLEKIEDEVIQGAKGDVDPLNDPCKMKNFETNSSKSTHRLKGTGDAAACLAIIKKGFVIPNNEYCVPGPCSVNNVYQPTIPLKQKFIAIGVFYNILRDLGFDSTRPVRPVDIINKATAFCAQDYTTWKTTVAHVTHVQEKFLLYACPVGLYLYVLLVDVFKFPNTTDKIMSYEKVGTASIDWTMGALIYETEHQISNSPHLSPIFLFNLIAAFIGVFTVTFN